MKLAGWMLVAGVVAAGCSSATGMFGSGVPSEGRLADRIATTGFEHGVMAVGRDQDLNMRRGDGLGLVHAPALSRYLNDVLAKLIASSPVQGVPARVYIQATPEWGASASADANIYVNLGLIMALESEDELAAVLAHELSHVILGHHSSDVIRRSQQQLIVLTQIAAGIEQELIEEEVIDGGVMGDKEIVEQQGYLLQLNTAVLSPGWNRRQETEADVLGTDILIAAGYNKVAALTVLDKQAAIEGSSGTASASARPTLEVAPAGSQSEALINYGLAKFGQSLRSMFVSVGRSHKLAADRKQAVQTYINREYRRAARPKIRSAEWTARVGTGATKALLANYASAFDAEEKLVAGDLAGAEIDAKKAVNGVTSTHAYPRFIFYHVRLQQGDQERALRNLELAFKSPEPSVKIYSTAGAIHVEAGRVREAVTLLEGAYELFDQTPVLMPDLIRVYRLAGREQDANRLVLQCALEHPELRELCEPADQSESA